MKEILQQKRHRGVLLGKIVTILFILFLSVLAVFLLISNWNMYRKMSEAKKNGILANQKLEELKNRKGDLERKIDMLSTDSGIEKEIRDRFPLVKSGEEVIMIVESSKKSKDDSFVADKPSLWNRFVDWINN
jgi:cell division protein FtsB